MESRDMNKVIPQYNNFYIHASIGIDGAEGNFSMMLRIDLHLPLQKSFLL